MTRSHPTTTPPHRTDAIEGLIVGVDTARLLVIDPGYLPPDVIEQVMDFVRCGLAAVINTRSDGGYLVEVTDDAATIPPDAWSQTHATMVAGSESDLAAWR